MRGFETARSALDMGARPARVAPRTSVPYVPSAALLLHLPRLRERLGDGDLFAPDMHVAEDVDLCWRAHLSGARVVVVPAAVARHRGHLAARRADLNHQGLAARHRAFSMATLTGARRTPLVILQSLLLGIAQFVVGLFTGTAGAALPKPSKSRPTRAVIKLAGD